MVILNSAIGLYLGIDNCSVGQCIEMARGLIDSGKAAAVLEEFVRCTNEAAL